MWRRGRANASPTFRHQVFELPVLPLDITGITRYFTVIASTAMLLARGATQNGTSSGQMGHV